MKHLKVYGQFAGFALLGLLSAAGIVSCGGGTTDLAGIGGTGSIVTANGRITGFGSIYVNGVKYDTDSAAINVQGESALVTDLKLGMVVTVNGTVDANGLNGVANMVSFRAEIKGPVVGPAIDTAGQTLSLTVLGVPVVADKGTTVFSPSATYADFGFATVAANDIVEISGFYDATGTLNATHVEKKGVYDGNPNTLTEVEIRGVISGFIANQSKFTLASGVTVDYANANLVGLPAGLATGLKVEVEGWLQGPMTIKAFQIEKEDRGLPHDADKVEIEGIVTDYQSLADFKVAGQPVDASGTAVSFEPTGLALANGMQIEVEGRMANGVLYAREVEGRGGNVEIEAFVSAVDSGAKTITLAIAPSKNLKVEVDHRTLMKDETGSVPGFGLADIAVGDFLEIEAFIEANLCQTICTPLASHVKRTKAEDAVKLEGPAAGADVIGRRLTILNIRFDTSDATKYKKDEQTVTAVEFFGILGNAGSPMIVEVKDTRVGGTYIGDGVADKLEIDD